MHLQNGLEILLSTELLRLKGQRVGLVTHPAAVLSDLTGSLDALQDAGVRLTAIFAPEHGWWGYESDAKLLEDTRDVQRGLPVFSLYGSRLAPDTETLSKVDMLIFDIQDAGVRFYTYISTLFHVLKSCAQSSVPLVVLDRPNPLRGLVGESPSLQSGYESFVGVVDVPALHGLTMGEMARWMVDNFSLSVDLTVIPMLGWERRLWFDETGLSWVPTSPGLPHFSSLLAYPCTCLMEGTNVSEGRGTGLPFEQVGAPWLDGWVLARELNRLELPGVRFRPVRFKPCESKYSGEVCGGIQVHITERDAFRPFFSGLHVASHLLRSKPEQFYFLEESWEGNHPHFDMLVGNAVTRNQLLAGVPVEEIVNSWREDLLQYETKRQPFLLYP